MGSQYKKKVHARDKVCQKCGSRGSKENPLTVHHIKPRSLYPKLASTMSNLTLLCLNCHKAIHQRKPRR